MRKHGVSRATFYISYFFNLKSPYVWKAAIWLQKSLQKKVRGVLEIKFTGQFENDKK